MDYVLGPEGADKNMIMYFALNLWDSSNALKLLKYNMKNIV